MNKISLTLLTLSLLLVSAMNVLGQKDRADIDDKYKWNFTDLYESDAAWSSAKDKLAADMNKVTDFKGQLGESATNLLNYMQFSDELMKKVYQLYILCLVEIRC
ncbi:hypothetical protein [Carboxylicivirga marina]|uniref:hypothetical protein n=1 Tax=Carboxylicivirga marina TaxID=2800988 RepID=UPI002594A66E|nr:hypothetical protein [uncultured Carboxylicivirga sp.]